MSITLRELAKHNTKDDLWIAIHGKVYDVTSYLDHPGTYDILVESAGTDATESFDDAEHPDYVIEGDLNSYYVGPLAQEEPPSRIINTEELMRHNDEGDIWVAVNGKVYDVSNFSDHPGSMDPLLENAGTDATEEFENTGHGDTARAMMADYYIGEYFETGDTSHLKRGPEGPNPFFILVPFMVAMLAFVVANYMVLT